MTAVATKPLVHRLRDALDGDERELDALSDARPGDELDQLSALAELHALWLAPLSTTGGRERLQSHPAVVALKARLERSFLDGVERAAGPRVDIRPDEAAAAMRRVAAMELVPAVYRWIAEEATWDDVVDFLSVEGGPDAGFDDLVAIAQVGIRGVAKVALAANYWDELGQGDPAAVHTVLHDRLIVATAMSSRPLAAPTPAALRRSTLGGVLATNRWLQLEFIGALGLLELQAGPRCRAVVRAFDRLGAPSDARPFYEEHAMADPHHGRDWLNRVVGPLAQQEAVWATRMVRGAQLRHAVNTAFFAEMNERFRLRG